MVKASLSYHMSVKKKMYQFGFSYFTLHRKPGKSKKGSKCTYIITLRKKTIKNHLKRWRYCFRILITDQPDPALGRM
jgi:hypothetical protein